jgi:hypothetical protein
VGFEVAMPTGSLRKGISEGVAEYEPFLILARDVPALRNLHLSLQLALGFADRWRSEAGDEEGEAEPAAHELNAGLAMFLPAGPARYTLELTWSSNAWNHGGDETEAYLTPGLVLDLPGTWEVGMGVPIGLTRDADDFRVMGHLIYEFELLGD